MTLEADDLASIRTLVEVVMQQTGQIVADAVTKAVETTAIRVQEAMIASMQEAKNYRFVDVGTDPGQLGEANGEPAAEDWWNAPPAYGDDPMDGIEGIPSFLRQDFEPFAPDPMDPTRKANGHGV